MIPLKDENPVGTVPFVTAGLIAVNFFVYAYMLTVGPAQGDTLVYRFSVVPSRLIGGGIPGLPELMTPVSSMFMHGGLLHICGNMLFLWVFGDNIEDRLGHLKFLAFYLVCGLAAAAAHTAANPDSALPMLGASGAVSGVMGAYMLLYPRARVWTLFFLVFFWKVVRVPALLFLGLWGLIQFLNGLTASGQQAGGVAWFAHIGGFLAGMALIFLAVRRIRTAGRSRRPVSRRAR